MHLITLPKAQLRITGTRLPPCGLRSELGKLLRFSKQGPQDIPFSMWLLCAESPTVPHTVPGKDAGTTVPREDLLLGLGPQVERVPVSRFVEALAGQDRCSQCHGDVGDEGAGGLEGWDLAFMLVSSEQGHPPGSPRGLSSESCLWRL